MFRNCRPWDLPWNVQDNAGWLDLEPDSGTGELVRVTAHVNTTQLPQGTHWAIVTVHSDAAQGDDRYLRVRDTVHGSGDRLYVWPQYLSLPANVDTVFTVSVMLELRSVVAMAMRYLGRLSAPRPTAGWILWSKTASETRA